MILSNQLLGFDSVETVAIVRLLIIEKCNLSAIVFETSISTFSSVAKTLVSEEIKKINTITANLIVNFIKKVFISFPFLLFDCFNVCPWYDGNRTVRELYF